MPAFTAHLLEVSTIPAAAEKRKRRRLIRHVACATMRSMLGRIRRLVRRRDWEQHSVDEWNRQYTSSAWRYLSGLEQTPRYAVIEAWRRRLKPSGSVLDLGCGEGVLFEHIAADEGVDYTGVDLAQAAIDAAAHKIRDAACERFVCADLATF